MSLQYNRKQPVACFEFTLRVLCCRSRFALKKAQENAVLRNKAARDGTLSVKVIKATDLMAADLDMTSDPCDIQPW